MKVHRNVAIIKGQDATVLKELQAVIDLDGVIMHWLSDTVVVLEGEHVQRIITELRRNGYKPKVVEV